MSEDNVRFKADRLCEIKRMQQMLKQEQDELEGYFLARCVADLRDTKYKSVSYDGETGKVTATMAESLKLIYPTLLKAALGGAYDDIVTTDTKYKLSAHAARMLTGLWTRNYTRMTVAQVVEQLPADDKIKALLLKKLKGVNYETDKKNLVSIGGYDEKTAEGYAYFIAEAAVWETFLRLMKANKTDTNEDIINILDLINGAVIVEETPKIAIELAN